MFDFPSNFPLDFLFAWRHLILIVDSPFWWKSNHKRIVDFQVALNNFEFLDFELKELIFGLQ